MISRTGTLALLLTPIAFIITFPFLVITLLLNELGRAVVSSLIKSKFKGKAVLANGPDSFWGYQKPNATRNCFAGIIVPSGGLNSEVLAKFYESKIQNFKDPNGERIFEKFEKIFVPTYGYSSWVEDEKFNVRNQIRFLDNNKVYTPDDVHELLAEELDKDMGVTKPQWEIIAFSRYNDGSSEEKTLLLSRWLHAYMDGLSFVQLFKNCMGDNFEYTIDPMNFPVPLWKKVLFYTNTLIYGWFAFLILPWDKFTLNPWIIQTPQNNNVEKSPSPRRKYYHSLKSDPIDMDILKKIRMNADRCTVPNIISTAFALAAAKVLPKDRIVPELYITEILAYLPYPDIKPQNRYTLYTFPMSSGAEDPMDKLRKCKQESLKGILGPETLMYYCMFKLFNRLPSIFMMFPHYKAHGSSVISNLPLSKTKSVLRGGKEVEKFIAWTPQPTDLGLSITTMSYAKGLQICGCADSTWLSKEELANIIEQMPLEIETMADLCQLSISPSSTSMCDQITTTKSKRG